MYGIQTKATERKPIPLAYLITFTCYGARLHGHKDGSVDKNHNVYGTPHLPANPRRVSSEERRAKNVPYKLDVSRRSQQLQAVQTLCEYRGWVLLAAHVRRQHVHIVIAAQDSPEKILHGIKAYASRTLAELDGRNGQRWTRHGSTRYLWKPEEVGTAVNYVVREPGAPMAVWERIEPLA
jgi:REP element-mobilizing transposase RayT